MYSFQPLDSLGGAKNPFSLWPNTIHTNSGQIPFLRTGIWMFLPFPVHRYPNQKLKSTADRVSLQAGLLANKTQAGSRDLPQLFLQVGKATPISSNHVGRGSACCVSSIPYPRRPSFGVIQRSTVAPGSKHRRKSPPGAP